jgi:hypothetical protein
MKTNTKEYKKLIRAAILECIDTTESDFNDTEMDKMLYFAYRFEVEFNHEHNKKRFPNLQIRIADYLGGIPFNFPYTEEGIIQFAKDTGTYTVKTERTIINNYFKFMAYHIVRYCEALNIPL